MVNFAQVLSNINIFAVGVLLDADHETLKNQCLSINLSKVNELNII